MVEEEEEDVAMFRGCVSRTCGRSSGSVSFVIRDTAADPALGARGMTPAITPNQRKATVNARLGSNSAKVAHWSQAVLASWLTAWKLRTLFSHLFSVSYLPLRTRAPNAFTMQDDWFQDSGT